MEIWNNQYANGFFFFVGQENDQTEVLGKQRKHGFVLSLVCIDNIYKQQRWFQNIKNVGFNYSEYAWLGWDPLNSIRCKSPQNKENSSFD